MATRKRAARRSGLVGRAVRAGRQALKEAESRIPPDLRRRVDRGIKDADKAARAAIKELQVQVKRASTRADVNSVLKRIDGLTRQARQIAQATGPRKAAPARRRAATTTRKAGATRKVKSRTAKAASTTRRRTASTAKRTSGGSTASRARRTTSRPTTARRSPSRRTRATEAPMPQMVMEPEAMGEIEIVEITEA